MVWFLLYFFTKTPVLTFGKVFKIFKLFVLLTVFWVSFLLICFANYLSVS